MRGDDDPVKPSDLSEAEREALKRQYRGVFWDRKTRRWRCQLGYQSKKIFLGYFDDAGEAARAYDQKLVELRGAGARTNFPITEYLDMMPTPTKRGAGSGAAAAAAAAVAAAAAREGQHNMDEDDQEDDGEEIDQPAPSGRGAAAVGGNYGAETPSLEPVYSSGAGGGGRLGGLLDMPNSGAAGGFAAGGSSSPRHGLSHLPAIAPLSTELPGDQHHAAAAALAAQDYDMAGEDELTAAAQLAIEIRRSFDGSNYKWQQQHHHFAGSGGGVQHQQLPTANSTGSAGGSAGAVAAAAAAAAGYGGHGGSDFDIHQQRPQQHQHMGSYGDDTAAAAAAGYGGNASLYGSYGHHHQQQQHYAQHHAPLRNGSTTGEVYSSNQGWADQAAAAAAGGTYEGHTAYGTHGSSHYPHQSGQQHHHHHSHSGVASAHGFSDSGGFAAAAHGGYPLHHQQQHHSHQAAAAAAAAAGYSHHAHHAHYQQHHARHYQVYHHHHQQQQAAGGGPGFYTGADGVMEDQHMATAGHMHGQQQQHYHGHHPHHQQQHGHYPLHHSHSYPGAAAAGGHEASMEGTAAAGYYHAGSTGVYTSHAQAVAAAAARAGHAHSSGHYQQHHSVLHHHQQQYGSSGPGSRPGGELTAAQGMYGSSGDLQHYGGGLAAQQQQQQQPPAQQQQYDARAAASNAAVAAGDYRQRLVTYGLHGYSSEDYGAAGMEGEGHRDYASSHGVQQHYQQQEPHMQHPDADLTNGPTAMDAAGPAGGNDCYNNQQAACDTEDPWIQAQGFAGRGSAAGSEGGGWDGGAGEALPAVKTTRVSGRTSRAANRGAAVAESDDYDVDDDDDYGSDSDTGRGRGRNGRRRSRAAAAAGAQNGGEGVLRTKQRTDAGEEDRGHSYRGVFWDKKSRRWRCQLGHKNKKIFLGYFGVAEDAARAYDQKLVELHGATAKTNFPIQNYLGGGSAAAGGRDTSAAVAAESPKAPGGADVPGRRRSSHAGDASAKASQAQQSELSWGALGLSRSARLSQDASEGAPRLSWPGVDTMSSWDQQDPDSQYAKRRRLMEGGGQLPTSPQDYGALHGSHQAVGGDDMLPASMARQGSGYRVVETPSVLTASLTGRHSSSGQAGGHAAPSFDAAAAAAGILSASQQSAGRNSLALSRLASGEVGAVQALSGLHHALGDRANAGAAGEGFQRAGQQQQAMASSSAAANAVLAAAGAAAAAAASTAALLAPGSAAVQHSQQQQSHASRLFEEAVHQYGSRASAQGLPPGPCSISAAGAPLNGRMSDLNTGASSSTATPPSAITAGGLFGPGASVSPQNASQAALSRLTSSEVRAVQALSGIHHDLLPYHGHGRLSAGGCMGGSAVADGSGGGDAPWGGFSHQQQHHHHQQGYMGGAGGQSSSAQQTPASITETVAKELLCRAPAVSAVASSSIAAVAAAAAAAAAAKSSDGLTRNSADGSFSGLVGEMAAGLGDSRMRAATPTEALNTDRLSTPALSPLLASSMLLPPPPPLQLQLDGQDLGESLPGTASATAAAAAAAAGIASAAGKAAGAGADATAAARLLSHLDPGDAFASEAGWGSAIIEDLLMPRKRPSCSGNSGLIGLLENIGQFKHEADAAAAAVAVPQQQQPAADQQQQQQIATEAKVEAEQGRQQQQQQQAMQVAPAAAAVVVSPFAELPSEVATVVPAAVKAETPAVASLPAAPLSFLAPTAEPMMVQP